MSDLTYDEETKKYRQDLMDLIEEMCNEIINDKPEGEEIPLFMISWLKSKGGFTTSGLSKKEKAELERLKEELEAYRKLDYHQFMADQMKSDKKTVKLRIPPEEKVASEDEGELSDEVDVDLDDLDKIKARASKKQRKAICEEVSGKKNELDDFKYKKVKKPPEQYSLMKIKLAESPLFSELDPKTFDEVVSSMEEKNIGPGTTICKQDDWADTFYYIVEGELECKVQFIEVQWDPKTKAKPKYIRNEPRLVKIYTKGDYFGEMPMLYHAKWRGSIMTTTDVKCYTLNKKTYKKIIKDVNDIRYNDNLDTLGKIQILRTLDPKEKEKLIDSLKKGIYLKGDKLVSEDTTGDCVYIVDEGTILGTKTKEIGQLPEKLHEYKKGDILGEKCLLEAQVWDENLVAKSDVVIVNCLNRHDFKSNIGNLEEILIRSPEVYNEYFPPDPEKDKKTVKEEEEEEKKKKVEIKVEEVKNEEVDRKTLEDELIKKYEEDKKRIEEELKTKLEKEKKQFEEATKKKYEEMLENMKRAQGQPNITASVVVEKPKEQPTVEDEKPKIYYNDPTPNGPGPDNGQEVNKEPVPGSEFINNFNNPNEEENKEPGGEFIDNFNNPNEEEKHIDNNNNHNEEENNKEESKVPDFLIDPNNNEEERKDDIPQFLQDDNNIPEPEQQHGVYVEPEDLEDPTKVMEGFE